MKAIESFSGEYRFLSNFYPAEVDLDGKTYPTLEHAYQAAKTLSLEQRELIRRAGTPGKAKKMGRQVTLREDWEKIKIGVMRELLRRKFQDRVLRAEIVATGDAKLVESNTWRDFFWGVYQGKGENWLGRLLMEIREEIRGR